MENEPVQNAENPTKKAGLRFGLSIAIVIICLVAAGVAYYWIKTEPTEENTLSVNVVKPTNDIAGWKTFQSIDFEVQFKYPQDWEISSSTGSGNGVFKRSTTQNYPSPDLPIDGQISLFEIDNPNSKSLQQIFIDSYNNCLKEEEKSPGMGCPGYEDTSKWQKIKIDNKDAQRSGARNIPEGLPMDSVYIALDGKYLEISAIYYNEKYSIELSKIFNQILSTFKFISPFGENCTPSQVKINTLQPIQQPTATSSVFLVTKAGGKIFSPDNKMALEIPEGAVAGNNKIKISIVDSSPLGALVSYDISPVDIDSLEFLKPTELSISYSPDKLPKNASEKDTMLGELGEFESWNIIDSCVDTVNHAIRSQINKIEKN